MILKVKEFCEAEHKNHGVLIPINKVRKRVAAMTGVSEKTVTRLQKKAQQRRVLLNLSSLQGRVARIPKSSTWMDLICALYGKKFTVFML
ncbi:hypothetical protein K1T71_002526 [Dendrolimus kikuchii]|uniref:Uncharacterized protein n=1 Tax=Dendrolimus kikuchii TaxID=765133 RepID=A0ACC1DCV6_9NEOP|nr:hypothetical protein K1T71_002526 [Dendrolimus kikuchii]